MAPGYFHNGGGAHHCLPTGVALLFLSYRYVKMKQQADDLSTEH